MTNELQQFGDVDDGPDQFMKIRLIFGCEIHGILNDRHQKKKQKVILKLGRIRK